MLAYLKSASRMDVAPCLGESINDTAYITRISAWYKKLCVGYPLTECFFFKLMRQWAGCYALGVVIELNFWSKLCEKKHENTQHIHSNIHTIPCKWLGATGQVLPNRAPNKNTTIAFWTTAQFEQFSLTGTTIQENKEKNKEA